jgi:ribonuclease P protein component
MGESTFGKDKRLLKACEYTAVFDTAEYKVSEKPLLVLARRSSMANNRLGLIIAKKNVRLAVQRNRIKRIIRESFRAGELGFDHCDVIVLARRGLGELDNASLHALMGRCWQKLEKKASTVSESASNPPNRRI